MKSFSENNENLQKLENLSELKLATTPICCLFSSYFGRWKYLPTLILVSLEPGMFQVNSELSFAVFAAYFWDISVDVICTIRRFCAVLKVNVHGKKCNPK